VRIVCIFYDGVVPTSEADEYVEIKNFGASAVDLAGWTLKDTADGTPTFTFPSFLLQPGQTIRVYTNQVHQEWGGFSFGRGSAIWSNNTTDPDRAGLFNAQGVLLSEKSYPPGCGA
jgi:hypothetical protein